MEIKQRLNKNNNELDENLEKVVQDKSDSTSTLKVVEEQKEVSTLQKIRSFLEDVRDRTIPVNLAIQKVTCQDFF